MLRAATIAYLSLHPQVPPTLVKELQPSKWEQGREEQMRVREVIVFHR